MVTSPTRTMNETSKMLALTFILLSSLFYAGVMAQEVTAASMHPLKADETRGDGEYGQIQVDPSLYPDPEQTTPEATRVSKPVPQSEVICVAKEAIQDKDAVALYLRTASTCQDTKSKIASILQDLCREDCKLDIFQDDYKSVVLVSGQYVQEDAAGMAERFNNDNIKDKIDVIEAVPRFGKSKSKLVLVSLLLAGLLLAALLIAGYCLKTHRKNVKEVRLESYQVDEENQANTLMSVVPLPQEPVDKPTINGESPLENRTTSTNGHTASQTPVADTEM